MSAEIPSVLPEQSPPQQDTPQQKTKKAKKPRSEGQKAADKKEQHKRSLKSGMDRARRNFLAFAEEDTAMVKGWSGDKAEHENMQIAAVIALQLQAKAIFLSGKCFRLTESQQKSTNNAAESTNVEEMMEAILAIFGYNQHKLVRTDEEIVEPSAKRRKTSKPQQPATIDIAMDINKYNEKLQAKIMKAVRRAMEDMADEQ